jgi:SAM-dependent methyltransferase
MTAPISPLTAGYALDSTWHAERRRLQSLTGLYDPASVSICERLGLRPGWRCADVGAGTGSLAQELAARVAPGGSVLAVDVDTRFLEPLAVSGLEVLSADVTTQPLPQGAFDLVHARLLLEHLPSRDDVLSDLTRALRPGGWLLIEDFDWATAGLVDPPSPTYTRVADACRAFLSSHGYDPSYGRRLPRALRGAGLLDVGVHAESRQVWADVLHGIPQWGLLVDQLAPGLTAAGLVDETQLDEFRRLLHDGRTACFAPLMVSCWGRRGDIRDTARGAKA